MVSVGSASPGTTVNFACVLGDVRFVSGEMADDGKRTAVSPDETGTATVQFIAGQPGLSIIQVTSGGSTMRVAITATNVTQSDSR